MPKQIQGFNEDGESKWFDGDRLPAGWSLEDPTAELDADPNDEYLEGEDFEDEEDESPEEEPQELDEDPPPAE